MAGLRIPQPYRKGVAALAELPAAQVEELIGAITAAAPHSGFDGFANAVASPIEGIRQDIARPIVEALIGLAMGLHVQGTSLALFAAEVSQSEDLKLAAENQEPLQDALRRTLGLPSLVLSAKALILSNQVERRFHDAQIVTDTRPIFGDDVSATPEAALVFHQLRVRYHLAPDQKLEDIYIALNPSDLRDLRDVLDRASSKAVGIAALLQRAGVKNLTEDGV